jgi:hypothetical protein
VVPVGGVPIGVAAVGPRPISMSDHLSAWRRVKRL